MLNKILDAAIIAAAAVAVIVTIETTRALKEVPETTATVPTTTETQQSTQVPTETTQPTTVATAPPETEAPITLYDVPLDTELQLHIISEAESKGIDPAIVFAMAWKESTYTTGAIGDGGNSYGLLQVQPKWHWERMKEFGCNDKEDLLDPYKNVLVAVDYLAEQTKRYGGDIAKGLTAYNRGHYNGTVAEYAKVVLAAAEELRGTTYETSRPGAGY